jgi:hypothetical protein
MNLILLTVLALGGTGGEAQMSSMDDGAYADSSEYVGGHSHRLHHTALHGCCMGPMPQTCYDPPYGCYPGTRWNNRYPAFHGTYYRKAYNYRNYFDYPWHAELHEPTSNWSYHVTGDTGAPAPLPAPPREGATPGAERQVPPQPMPTQASFELPLIDEVRSNLEQPSQVRAPGNSLRTLRR